MQVSGFVLIESVRHVRVGEVTDRLTFREFYILQYMLVCLFSHLMRVTLFDIDGKCGKKCFINVQTDREIVHRIFVFVMYSYMCMCTV